MSHNRDRGSMAAAPNMQLTELILGIRRVNNPPTFGKKPAYVLEDKLDSPTGIVEWKKICPG